MSNLYQFGPFRLDTQEHRLLSDGKPVQLTPKGFELLRVLVENPGRLLHKDELLKLVWPDSYVEEGNLSHHVFALRKALGDEKASTQYIETVPRRGYRFIADVQEVKETDQSRAIATGNASLTDAAPQIPGVFVHDRRWPLRATASAVVILLAMTVLGIVGYRWRVGNIHSAASSAPRRIAVLPFKPIVVTDRDESLEWGMAETLITRLGGVSEIRVRPFSAMRRYGSLDQDPAAAGRELGVEAVLDGNAAGRWPHQGDRAADSDGRRRAAVGEDIRRERQRYFCLAGLHLGTSGRLPDPRTRSSGEISFRHTGH
jgi:DNA-binding winged helix-turn-helix (wHTH) protein